MKVAFTAKSLKSALFAGAALGCFATPSVSFAQAEQVDDEDDNIITVIARKNEESLQDVPVTVTAINRDTLDRYQVDEIADVASRVPSLVIQVGGSGAGGSVNLRGVGSSAISAAFDSAVAFDIDGVAISTSRLVQAGFFDAQQIDVLKGPQSLFFGKSSTAGVFSIRSADPTPDWEIGGKAAYEFEEKGYTIGGYISGPLTDTLGIRLAGQYNDVDEFNKVQPGTPAVVNPRGLTNLVTRLTLDWEPVDIFDANLKVSYIRNTNDGSNLLRDQDCGPNGVADPIIIAGGATAIANNADCNIGDSLFPQVDATPIQGQFGQAPSQNRGAAEFAARNGAAFGITDIWFGRLKFNVDISDSLTLSSTTGYLDFKSLDRDVFSFVGVGPAQFASPAATPFLQNFLATNPNFANDATTPLGVGGNLADNQTRQLTQELRLASDFDGPINFQIGAFYETREIEFNSSEQALNITLTVGPDPFGTGNTFDYHRQHETDTEAFSLFGSVDIDFTDRLHLTAGLRWTDEQKSNTIRIPYISPVLTGIAGGALFVGSGFVSNPIKFSDSNFSPEVSLTYNVTDDINVFAAFKTGFKSGGIDNSALPGAGLGGIGNLAINPMTGNTFDADATAGLIFDSETAIGGEIGIKSQFADRALTVNATAFYYIYDDLQVQLFNAVAIQFNTFNAGELTTQGIDVDWSWRTPVEGLRLSGALAYLDSAFSDTFIGTDGTDFNGRAAPRAPEFSGNIAADWFIPAGDNFEIGLSGNVAYSGSYFTGQSTAADIVQGDFITLDGAISVGDPDGKWKLSLVGSNLTDKQFITSAGPRPFLNGPVGAPTSFVGIGPGDDQTVTLTRGRTVAAEISFKF
ncbi:MAG: TonB-dependent receptor [Parasphingorhabdus sp.]